MALQAATSRPPDALEREAPAAGFVSRLCAMAIDIGVLAGLIAAVGSMEQLVQVILPSWIWIASAAPVALGAIVSILPGAYFFTALAIAGRTPGKAVLGLRVVTTKGHRLTTPRALLRTIAYIVSLIPLGLGFFWVLVSRDRRGWHDYVAGSRVVYDRSAALLWGGDRRDTV